ncbi:MAG TPA: DUF3043 domain-containing protein [Nocardioidaceae bacterium]|nr:DUF3043 domain-containing protein [Nocardioidaceae bacterium]
MFGRRTAKNSSEAETVDESLDRLGGKGRPTPKRSEAEKARKKRMTPPRDRKQASAMQRERMRAEREKRMQAMKTGDERYLPARDRGPVRHFVRDFVDSRRSAAEFLLPLLVVILALSFVPRDATWAVNATVTLWMLTIVLTALDSVFLTWRLGRALRARFPDTSTRGAKFYGLLRSSQMRFLRMPKSQVKVGTKLPERY